jgi:RNA polymerase sigma-70 factor (ECF subfamily)
MLHSPRHVGRLVDAFLGARNAGGARPSATFASDDDAESALAALHARGRAAYPALPIEDVAFAAHLGRCDAGVLSSAGAAALHAEDLYLCCAALLGDAAAVRALRDGHHAVVISYLRTIDTSAQFVDDVEARLWDSALTRSAEAPPKLLSYSGRGPLASWTGVVAQRIALTLRRHEAAETRALHLAATEARLVGTDPELAFVKASLRDAFQRALTDALMVLDDRQRMVYRLHIIDGLTVEAIADMYSVVRSTVTRWIAAARAAIIDEAKRLLRDEMRLPAEDFESLARLLASQLDLSISHILARSA